MQREIKRGLLLPAPEGLQTQLFIQKGEDKKGSSLGRAHPRDLRRYRRGTTEKTTPALP